MDLTRFTRSLSGLVQNQIDDVAIAWKPPGIFLSLRAFTTKLAAFEFHSQQFPQQDRALQASAAGEQFFDRRPFAAAPLPLENRADSVDVANCVQRQAWVRARIWIHCQALWLP